MARKDAIDKLRQRLFAQRDDLRDKISGGLDEQNQSPGDAGETAARFEQAELNTQLASLECRELLQIEQALEMIDEGRYGFCEACDKAIPVSRLQALPFAPYCFTCQQQQEASGTNDNFEADWRSAAEFERRGSVGELSLRDLDQSSDE